MRLNVGSPAHRAKCLPAARGISGERGACHAQGLGHAGGAPVFGALLLAVYATYRWTHLSRTALFWAAFILTRPLGAVVGDFLDKPLHDGGLALSRFVASLVLLAFIVAAVAALAQRAASSRH